MKLYYFDLYGRGEPIRLLLNHAKQEFEDVRISFEDWGKFKEDPEKCKYGQVPILEREGKQYTQSSAIMSYLGESFGYSPEDIELRFKAAELVDLISADFFMTIIKKIMFAKSDEER